MHKIIFFDTETTGNTEKDFLCQIAYKEGSESFSEIYKPIIPIPPEASSIHHISNKMVEERPYFRESNEYSKIKQLFEEEKSVVVAHNALFDLAMIKKEDINPLSYICTLRVARHLDEEGKIEKYNLQYLRYALEIEIDATAHDAMGDVLVLEKLFERLKKKVASEAGLSDTEAIQKMIEISSRPSLFHKLSFGKHKGKLIKDVLNEDKGWLEWLLKEKEKSASTSIGGDEDWIYTLKYYLNK
ncbi:MAG: 3'-5' exonuclease [Candidatus Paceibacterota bacterium]